MSIQIQVQNVSKRFGETQALKGIDLNFEKELMHGVIGPEGAGKSTLFRCLMGLLKPDQGNSFFKEEKKEIPFSEVRFKLGYMPQQQSLYPDLSIQEHLEFFKELYGLSKKEFQEKSERLLSVTRLGDFLSRPAGKLSGGMYKKLGLMCALLSSPEILLLDEPTNGVDPISRREFWELLYDLKEEKILILVATAYMDEAERCSKVHLLDKGRVMASGEPKSLLAQEQVHSFDEFFLKKGGNHES